MIIFPFLQSKLILTHLYHKQVYLCQRFKQIQASSARKLKAENFFTRVLSPFQKTLRFQKVEGKCAVDYVIKTFRYTFHVLIFQWQNHPKSSGFFVQITIKIQSKQYFTMKNKLVLVFIALVSLSACWNAPELWISQQSYSLDQVSPLWNAFTPVIYGGSGKYLIKYDNIPAHWDDYHAAHWAVTDNVLLIPKNADGRYQVRVEVHDLRYKNSISKYLILQFMNGYLQVFVRDSYDKFANYDKFYKYEKKDIVEYPSWDKVEYLIEEGNVQQLKTIINRIIKSDNDCDKNRAFFNGVISRMEKFVKQSDHKIHQLKAQIEAFLDQIALKKDLVHKLIQSLAEGDAKLKKLKWEMINAQEQLEWYLKRKEFTAKDIKDFFEARAANQKAIWAIKDHQIPALIAEIQKLENEISGMKKPIWWEKDPRWDWKISDAEEQLEKKKWMLENAKLRVTALEAKNNWYEKRIEYLKLTIDNNDPDIEELRKKIAKLNAEIQGKLKGQEGIDALNREIEKLESAIKYFEHEIKITKDAQWTIQEAIPEISVLIGKANYKCKHISVKDYKYEKGYKTGYFDWPEFDLYFKEQYGKYGKVPPMPKKNEVQVSVSDYYSAWWKNNMEKDPFVCYDLDLTVSYWGVVTKVHGNAIWVSYQSYQYQLQFASCSYLEVVGRDITVGRNIVWKGSKRNLGNKFYVAQAICY